MILLLVVILGLVVAQMRGGLRLPHLGYEWVAWLGFLPQLVLFSPLGQSIPLAILAMTLVTSQLILLVFIWLNRNSLQLLILGLGLLLNIAVIVANDGLMPISPDMAKTLTGVEWMAGQRLGNSKDLVMLPGETRLWELSDRFLLALPGYYVAYSPGDILIALGAFLLLSSQTERGTSWKLAKN